MGEEGVAHQREQVLEDASFILRSFQRHVFKMDEVGLEIIQIALPMKGKCMYPVAYLIDTALIGHLGTYKKIPYNLREFWKGLCSDQIGGQVLKTFKKPLSFKDPLKKTLGRLLTLFPLSFPVAYACILVF